MDVLQSINYGFISILPPLIAIVLALITKEVITSLLTGILVGSLIYSNGNVIQMVVTAFEVMGNKMGENVYILLFLALLGCIVTVVTMGGGSAAYGEMAAKKIKTRKGAALATSALGCFIFIDDYFNCLSVGTVMKPLTDKHRISRAKLAYLIDATAAPVCIIAPVSSWGASIATYIQDAGAGNGMSTFIKIIPYNLYAILTIVMVLIICLSNVNFGSMARFEKNAIEKGDLFSGKPTSLEATKKEETKGKVIDLVIPILSLITLTILAMAYTGGAFTSEIGFFKSFGNANSSLSLVLGSFGALIVTFIQYSIRRILGFREFMEGISEGIKSMVPAFMILILAWTIGGICSVEYLNTGGYVGNLVNTASFPTFILPIMVFVIAAFLGFATGTSWGTMALLIPIGVAICSSSSTSALLYPVLGAVLAGAVYGDHISPISDTTILSSTGAGCNHIDHVSTQLLYASVVAICCGFGYLIMGVMKSIIIPFILSLLLLIVLILIINQRAQKKYAIDYTKINK